MSDGFPADDVFNILVATDIHLGYEENHPIRGNDSFVTFEEILQIGRDNEVDFILLGGDLFHRTKPSSETVHRCMTLLREYCMGDRPISVEFLSDQEKNFENTTQHVVNYEDPNLNVSIPVYSIHGNHDDPTGEDHTSILDILSCVGLVNYFGKCVDLTDVPVNPILLRKGESLLAIYGLGHIVDQRLCRLFEAGKVSFYQPEEQQDDWFNILVLHQNRAVRGVKSYIDESALPGMLDLIIWGHEHDCRIDPEYNATKNFHVMQPGSSVATSLAEGESLPKHVAIVKVYKKEFECKAIPLKTVRPFVFRDTDTADLVREINDDMRSKIEQIEEGAAKIIDEMIEEASTKWTGHPKQPKEPLIRLRLYYSDSDDMVNMVRFNQRFEDKVANPTDLLMMKKGVVERKVKRDVLENEAFDRILQDAEIWDIRIEDYVKKYFEEQENKIGDDQKYRLNVLTVAGLNEAVFQMVEKQNNSALELAVKFQTNRIKEHLMTKDLDEVDIDDVIGEFYRERERAGDAETLEVRTQLESTRRANPRSATNGNSRASAREDVDDEIDEDIIEEEPEVEEVKGRGRGRGRAAGAGATRAATAAKTPRAARGSRAASSSAAGTTRGRGRGRGTAQPTLQQSFANSSQISVVRTSGRSTANRSRMQFLDEDDD